MVLRSHNARVVDSGHDPQSLLQQSFNQCSVSESWLLRLDTRYPDTYPEVMEVHFPPELQTRLTHIATQQGRDAGELVQDVVAQYLESKTRFLEAVERGIVASERGEFVEEEAMDSRIEQMLQS